MSDSSFDDLAGSAHDAAVADAAAQELNPGRSRASSECTNCGATLHGRFCSQCGQVADTFHRPVWMLVAEGLENLFSFDGRFWRTVPSLMLRPGRMTRAYLDGRRVSFVQPFRLFLVASILFFLLTPAIPYDDAWFERGGLQTAGYEAGETALEDAAARLRANGDEDGAAELDALREELRAEFEMTSPSGSSGEDADGLTREEAEALAFAQAVEQERDRRRTKCSIRKALTPEDPDPDCARLDGGLTDDGSVELAESLEIDGLDDLSFLPFSWRQSLVSKFEVAIDSPRAYFDAVSRWMPRMVFALFPIYALMLGILHFWRRSIYFYDHIIVSLHFHSYIFLLVFILMLLGTFVPIWILIAAFVVLSNLALFRFLRVVYADGFVFSAMRVLVLDLAYLTLLVLSVLVLAAMGIVFI